MASLHSEDTSDENLSQIFSEALKCQETIDNSDLPSASLEYQNQVHKGMDLLIKATKMVNLLSLFSRNEELEEIPTGDVKFLLLPALLGSLTCQLNSQDRKQDLERAGIYYKDFLRRVQDYSISSTMDNTTSQVIVDGKVSKELADMAKSRADKIARFKAKKSLEQRLKDLDKNKHLDDATMREYTITTVQLWITRCVDELDSTKQELEVLKYMESGQGVPPPVTSPPSAPFKPILITRDMIQKKVFGAGYPSLPTMSVEEWHEKRIRDGVIPPDQVQVEEKDMSKWVGKGPSREPDQGIEDVGDKSDEDEEEVKRRKDIRFDEFKDENKRGSGNRKNRS